VRLPPTIVKGPELHYVFRGDARIDMICVATASVDIRYASKYTYWYMLCVHKLSEIVPHVIIRLFLCIWLIDWRLGGRDWRRRAYWPLAKMMILDWPWSHI